MSLLDGVKTKIKTLGSALNGKLRLRRLYPPDCA